MKIAIIGATGQVGSRILAEALRRGHTVTAIARGAARKAAAAGVTAVSLDITDSAALARALAGNDAVVSAVRFISTPPEVLIKPIKAAGVKRWFIVGGAGSLEVAPGKALVDAPGFPELYKAEASAGRDFLNAIRGEQELEWTFLSPSAVLAPGTRTGKFRVGADQLLTAPNGDSSISIEDYAIAVIDELENPRHIRQRFTVGY